MSDFFQMTQPRAAKPYRCAWCGESIRRGELHQKAAGQWEGDWQDWRMHDECYQHSVDTEELQDGFSLYEGERPEIEVLIACPS